MMYQMLMKLFHRSLSAETIDPLADIKPRARRSSSLTGFLRRKDRDSVGSTSAPTLRARALSITKKPDLQFFIKEHTVERLSWSIIEVRNLTCPRNLMEISELSGWQIGGWESLPWLFNWTGKGFPARHTGAHSTNWGTREIRILLSGPFYVHW